MVTVRIPVPSGQAVTNLLGVLGLLGLVATVAGLAGGWWALGLGSLFSLGLAVLAQSRGGAVDAEALKSADSAVLKTALAEARLRNRVS